MKRILIILMMLLLIAVALVSCGKPVETTEATQMPEANVTPPTTTTEQVYYFQTADNFVELDSGMRGPSSVFRHDVEAFGPEGTPSVELTATIPSSVVIDGKSYELNMNSLELYGRTVKYTVKNASGEAINSSSYISFDAINGDLTGFNGFEVRRLTDEEKKMDPVALASVLVSQYLPHISMENYEVFYNNIQDNQYDNTFLGAIGFRKYIGEYSTEQIVFVEFDRGTLRGIHTKNMYYMENLDETLLEKIDKEENERIILSLIDYVRNGNKIKEPTLWAKSIVLMFDGRYAIRYDIDIQLDVDETQTPWQDRISACIYLEDSETG